MEIGSFKITKPLIVLAVFCGLLLVGSIIVYASQDRTKPTITVEKKEISYVEGENRTPLFAGVTAVDAGGKDLTDRVFIDKIVATKDGKALVYYAVVDDNKNVGNATREINYTPKADPTPTPQPTPTPTPAPTPTPEAEVTEEEPESYYDDSYYYEDSYDDNNYEPAPTEEPQPQPEPPSEPESPAPSDPETGNESSSQQP